MLLLSPGPIFPLNHYRQNISKYLFSSEPLWAKYLTAIFGPHPSWDHCMQPSLRANYQTDMKHKKYKGQNITHKLQNMEVQNISGPAPDLIHLWSTECNQCNAFHWLCAYEDKLDGQTNWNLRDLGEISLSDLYFMRKPSTCASHCIVLNWFSYF